MVTKLLCGIVVPKKHNFKGFDPKFVAKLSCNVNVCHTAYKVEMSKRQLCTKQSMIRHVRVLDCSSTTTI